MASDAGAGTVVEMPALRDAFAQHQSISVGHNTNGCNLGSPEEILATPAKTSLVLDRSFLSVQSRLLASPDAPSDVSRHEPQETYARRIVNDENIVSDPLNMSGSPRGSDLDGQPHDVR
jgi:hypothetical protein